MPTILAGGTPAVLGEVIVVGQFAYRGPAQAPERIAIPYAEPVAPPGWEHRALMPLPTEAYLAMRAATARHRERAYAGTLY